MTIFDTAATVDIARTLLGATLRVGKTAGIIVETEAYLADDPASHSCNGRSRRNGSMFLSAGHAYVYRSYGVHWCFNVVTGPAGVGEAVLVRALKPVDGIATMAERRGIVWDGSDAFNIPAGGGAAMKALCSGPGKLCQALGITGDMDGSVIGPDSPVSITLPDRVTSDRAPAGILATERIGISKGKDRLYRFVPADGELRRWISRPK